MRLPGRNRLTRRDLIRYGGAGAAGAAALAAAGCDLSDGGDSDKGPVQRVVTRDEHPMNVLLIVTDSTRRDFVSAYDGDKLADTPNLDALAKEGLKFDRAVPEAMPTVAVRRALLTGTRSFPFRDWKVAPKLPQFPGWSPIPAYKRIFTEFMDAAGIETAYVTDNPFLIGPRFERFRKTLDHSKSIYEQGEYRSWNIGIDQDRVASKQQIENYLLPALQGTEAEKRHQENVGFNRGRSGDAALRRAHAEGGHGRAARAEGQAAVLPRRRRVRPARGLERADRVQAALQGPQGRGADPAVQDALLEGRGPRGDGGPGRSRCASCTRASSPTSIPGSAGSSTCWTTSKLADRTVVYYLSDHGILLGEHGLMGKANSMLGKEIHRVPYMIRHPEGKRAGETSDYFASTHDVAPTILSFQGLTVPGRMDGEDLTVMFDGADPPERAYWTTAYADHVAAGDGRWLLIADNQGEEKRLFDTEDGPRRGERRGGRQPGRRRPPVGKHRGRRGRDDAGVRQDGRRDRLKLALLSAGSNWANNSRSV